MNETEGSPGTPKLWVPPSPTVVTISGELEKAVRGHVEGALRRTICEQLRHELPDAVEDFIVGEFGFGEGDLVDLILRHYSIAQVFATDPDSSCHERYARRARNPQLELRSSSIARLDSSWTGRFNVAILNCVMTYLSEADFRAGAGEIARVLRPDGCLFIGDFAEETDGKNFAGVYGRPLGDTETALLESPPLAVALGNMLGGNSDGRMYVRGTRVCAEVLAGVGLVAEAIWEFHAPETADIPGLLGRLVRYRKN